MARKTNKRWVIYICLVLEIAVLVTYWPVLKNDFVNYDDNVYVTENRNIQVGFAPRSIVWAFTTGYASNWHPLTWLSHMLDCQIYGPNPSGHHLTNLALHILNTLLLFVVLRKMTKALWQSIFVAAAFALHPLHVESVAWVAERKDVLSTFFWFLTMLAYLHYVHRPSITRYTLVLLSFALGLMAKPMLVTLPFVLLLLDYWPLGRFKTVHITKRFHRQTRGTSKVSSQWPNIYRLVREKIPLFAAATVSSVVTFFVQRVGNAVVSYNALPLSTRITNVFVSYLTYTQKMLWPRRLAVLYPHPLGELSITKAVLGVLFIVIICLCVIRFGSKYKYLPTGWFWFIGTLVPVIGLVQVGDQALADRYTYIPLTGLFIIIAWGLPELLKKIKYRKIVFGILTVAALLALSVCTRLQIRHWRNSATLFARNLEVTENNHVMHVSLAQILYQNDKLDQAIAHLNQALRIKPDHADAHSCLGIALVQQGNIEQGIKHLKRALAIQPRYVDAHANLAEVYDRIGELELAVIYYKRAVELKPSDPDLLNSLGLVLTKQGKFIQAVVYFRKALAIYPQFIDAHINLGFALTQLGSFDQAVIHLNNAVQLAPNSVAANYYLALALSEKGKIDQAITHLKQTLYFEPNSASAINTLAWLLAAYKDAEFYSPKEAISLAQEACELTRHENPGFLDTLAVAYAADGRFAEAVAAAEKALQLARSKKDHAEISGQIRDRLNLFKAGKPYVENNINEHD